MPTTRYINRVFAPALGEEWPNARLMDVFSGYVAELEMAPEDRKTLTDFLNLQLVGERSRYSLLPDWRAITDFASRAQAFEDAADRALDTLAAEIGPALREARVQVDALLTTTATGNIMPGLSYRLAQKLPDLVPGDALMVDLGNVGCTGSLKALNLAQSLDAGYKNILVVAVEVPSTLSEMTSPALDVWQGNCTFGDGAAALWISSDPAQGDLALEIESLNYRQRSETGLSLIRWGYRSYYTFALADQKTFDQDVRAHVVEALQEAEAGWKDEPRWAIHPAGIALLVRISRKLGIPSEAIQPSVQGYRKASNMSSASILHILKDVAADTPAGAAINLLSMGAGFNVIYGRVRRVR